MSRIRDLHHVKVLVRDRRRSYCRHCDRYSYYLPHYDCLKGDTDRSMNLRVLVDVLNMSLAYRQAGVRRPAGFSMVPKVLSIARLLIDDSIFLFA